jgi:hypothetical protein
VGRLVGKNKSDYELTLDVCRENIKVIKDLYTHLASKSEFPSITLQTIREFMGELKLIDPKVITSQNIERQFISAIVELEN